MFEDTAFRRRVPNDLGLSLPDSRVRSVDGELWELIRAVQKMVGLVAEVAALENRVYFPFLHYLFLDQFKSLFQGHALVDFLHEFGPINGVNY